MSIRWLWVLLVPILVLPSACGGGGGGVLLLSLAAPPEAALDGWIESTGNVRTNQGGPLLGDFDSVKAGVGHRQIFSFDVSGLPVGATVASATLRLYQAQYVGDPLATHGVVVVDHVAYGSNPTSADYGNAALTAGMGPLSADTAIEYKTLDVTAQVQDDLDNLRLHSQFRVRWSVLDTDNDGSGDYLSFTETEDSCCATGELPELLIEYFVP